MYAQVDSDECQRKNRKQSIRSTAKRLLKDWLYKESGPAAWTLAIILIPALLLLLVAAGVIVSEVEHPGTLRRAGQSAPVTHLSEEEIRTRAVAGIVGAYVADAASMGLHWIYDTNDIATKLEQGGRTAASPEFFEPPSSPFYTYKSGSSSPYGDEVLPLLKSMASEGKFDASSFASESVSFMSEYKGYINSVIKKFLANASKGDPTQSAVDDNQSHGMIKVPVLVARYAGSGELQARVEAAVRIHQDNVEAVDAAVAVALVLERVILTGESAQQAVRWAARGGVGAKSAALLMEGFKVKGTLKEAASKLGSSCHLPGAFQVSMFALAEMSSAANYASVLRKNILAGGDQCSRAMVMGSILGAQFGDAGIPQNWTQHMDPDRLALVRELATKVVEARNE
mmetsp:Transcript_13840/g.16680  ORF Transcript_13840/g.16680 Transcript_13840/m.16680 type:complete len:399 (+) Transcript_13840:262-1458(+)|eukprot:CAMPEP_0197858486 /NCGR_PEP_ID=MMETSP1438-20131217/32309_1 /TAXON_ID=1461541 /ORGANISM="Pterosperma sp., Strain CCMP1384" /LENGTH=398 /DNA_ID=CAMNT_0043474659 /DNA_START=262 /DNA_END=1458 /DNA_ORIENTATION=+